MNLKRVGAIALLAVVATAVAAGPGLRIRLGTIDGGAEARWQNQGQGDKAMFLAKFVDNSVFEAAGADFGNIAGTNAYDLNYLAWNVEDRSLGASVRWNIYTGPVGEDWNTVTFLGEVQVGEDGQISDSEIAAALTANGVAETDEIKYLQIIMDEQGSVTVDDIAVTIGSKTETFSGPGNSG